MRCRVAMQGMERAIDAIPTRTESALAPAKSRVTNLKKQQRLDGESPGLRRVEIHIHISHPIPGLRVDRTIDRDDAQLVVKRELTPRGKRRPADRFVGEATRAGTGAEMQVGGGTGDQGKRRGAGLFLAGAKKQRCTLKSHRTARRVPEDAVSTRSRSHRGPRSRRTPARE